MYTAAPPKPCRFFGICTFTHNCKLKNNVSLKLQYKQIQKHVLLIPKLCFSRSRRTNQFGYYTSFNSITDSLVQILAQRYDWRSILFLFPYIVRSFAENHNNLKPNTMSNEYCLILNINKLRGVLTCEHNQRFPFYQKLLDGFVQMRFTVYWTYALVSVR